MKKFFLTALMLFSIVSFAQSKFIEVEVTDTIALKPLSFQVNVYLESYDYTMAVDTITTVYEDNYDPMAEQEKEKNKLQEIKRKLEVKKHKVGPLSDSKGSLFNKRLYGSDPKGWTVIVNGESEVQKIKDMFTLNNDIRTEVSVLKYADELKAEEQLIKKLMDKAKARVVVIGSYSGLKPGRILEVKEGKQGGGFDMESYMKEMLKMSRGTQDDGNYTGSLSKTFVVKFAAE